MLDKGYIKKAWDLYIEEPLPFILAAIIFTLLEVLTAGILTGPVICGYIYMTFKKIKGERISFEDSFWGFHHLEKTFIPGLLYAVIVIGGFSLFIIPGVIFGAMLIYAFPLVVDKNLATLDAFKESWELTSKNILEHSLFYLVVSLIGISGALLFGVGVVFTLPLGIIPFAIAYYSFTYPAEEKAEI